MNTIEKLEYAINKIIVEIEENERIDRITKEKLTDQITNLFHITGEMKDERENVYDALHGVLSKL